MILPKENYVIVKADESLPKLLLDFDVGRVVSSNSEIYWENDIIYFKPETQTKDKFYTYLLYDDKQYFVLHEDQIAFVEN